MDAIDGEIIGMMREDGRISFSDLGRAVGLSTSAAAARVRRLEREGVILGYTVVTDDAEGGPRGSLEVFIDVRLAPQVEGDAFLAGVADLRGVKDVVHMTGAHDYLLHAFPRDTGELDSLLRSLKAHCGAAQTQTRIALRPHARAVGGS